MKAAVMTQRTGAGRDGPLSITRPTQGHALMQTSEEGAGRTNGNQECS